MTHEERRKKFAKEREVKLKKLVDKLSANDPRLKRLLG